MGRSGLDGVSEFRKYGIGGGFHPRDLQGPVLEELVERANLTRKPKGKILLSLLGDEYEVAVEEYDSFGESAFTLTLKKAKNAR